MANIRVDVPYTIKDGSEIVFRSPVDCSAITGLVVYCTAENGSVTASEFALTDAHGQNVGNIDHLFSENVIVKCILDVTAGKAYVQNADTNDYIERTFIKKNSIVEALPVEELYFMDGSGNSKIRARWEEELLSEDGDPTGQVLAFWGEEGDEPVVLRNVHDPVRNNDAATKRYVDQKVKEMAGQNLHGDLRTSLANFFAHVVPNFNDANGLAYINAVLAALGADPRGEGNTPDVPDEPVIQKIALADVSKIENLLIRSSDFTTRNGAGQWSVVVPYTEGMTVIGCFYEAWDANYSSSIITAPDGTMQHSEAFDARGELVAEANGSKPAIYQYIAKLTGYPAGSTVRISLVMFESVTTEEQARAWADERRELLYYIPGEEA